MSQENVDFVRLRFERFIATGEVDWDTLHEDVEVYDHDIPDRGEYRGHAGFGLWLRIPGLGIGLGFCAWVEFAPDELDVRNFSRVASAEADPQQTRVAPRSRCETRRQRVEQFADDRAVLHIFHDQAARVQRVPVLFSTGQSALRDGDEALDERSQLLGARHRCRQVLVSKQFRRLVPEHRDPMLSDASQLAVCYSVSHCAIPAMWRRAGRRACRGPGPSSSGSP